MRKLTRSYWMILINNLHFKIIVFLERRFVRYLFVS